MKKKRNKKILYSKMAVLLLMGCMTLVLCSCGTAADGNNKSMNTGKEHVYSFQEAAVPDTGGDEIDILASEYRNRTVSLLIKVTDWKNYNDNDIRILRFRDDASGTAVTPLETIPWNPAAEEDAAPQDNSSYDNCTFGADGRIYAVRFFSKVPDNPGEETISLRYLCCWAADGSLLWETELEPSGSEEGYVFINAVSVGEDGTARLILTGEHAWQITVDAQGASSGEEKLPEEVLQVFSSSISVLHQADGTLMIICYGEDNWEEQYFISYDPAACQLGKACKMPSSCGWDGYGAIAADGGSGLLYSSRAGICSCTQETAEGMEKMNFINSDLNVSSFEALVHLGDDSFAGVFYEGYGGRAHMGVFTYTDPADIPDRAVLVLAGTYISDAVIQRVVEFNRSSDRYRITVRNLEEYDSEEALAAGIAETTVGVFSGNMPDILVTEGLPAETYAAKGLLADIGELIRNDDELSRIEFLKNVFDAYSMNGKLYYLIPSFQAGTMIGASSVVGEKTSWTFADALQLLETLPAGTNLFPDTDRASLLQTMLLYCGGSFVNINTGKCSFQSQDFLDILEYAKSLPEAPDMDSYGEDYWRNYESQYREGRTVLAGIAVDSLDDARSYVNDLFGADVSYIGFPSENGGAYVRAGESYAISSHSEYIEGAWAFLRYYLTDEYQSGLETGLPVQRKYYSEKQPEKLVQFILSTDRRCFSNDDIMNIITEETGAFFSGDKAAQETAEIIQRRTQLYLDENLK